VHNSVGNIGADRNHWSCGFAKVHRFGKVMWVWKPEKLKFRIRDRCRQILGDFVHISYPASGARRTFPRFPYELPSQTLATTENTAADVKRSVAVYFFL